MATSSTSYLQTLTKDEAIAFATSLQKVKAHLSQERQWLETQVQQKIVQLQGMETLLSEVEALGLIVADTHLRPETTSLVAAPVAPVVATAVATYKSVLENPATENGITKPVATTEPAAALSVERPAQQPSDQQGNVETAQTLRGSEPSANTKTNTAKTKQPKPSTLSADKMQQRGRVSNLQQCLKRSFRNQALTESVSDILNRAATPLSTDEVMATLYDGLPKADYDRAKHSLANILSAGRSKGAWQSPGRGLYAGNAVATT
ncbi:MAG: hypothetical protein RBJ76_05005 [Stenomitos frigidus ULC029]